MDLRTRLIRSLRLVVLLAVIAGVWVLPPPGSWIALLSLLVWIAYIALKAPWWEDLGERAARDNPDQAHLMTIFDVADLADMPWKQVPTTLRKDGVPRADATGWRLWLPVGATNVTYRREIIEDWLRTRSAPGP